MLELPKIPHARAVNNNDAFPFSSSHHVKSPTLGRCGYDIVLSKVALGITSIS